MDRSAIRLQQFEAIGDVLALGAMAAKRAMKGIAAVKQKHAVLPAFRANRLDDCCKTIDAADATIAFRQRGKIFRRQRMRRRGFCRNVIVAQEFPACEMWRGAARFGKPKVDGRLAQKDWTQLSMQIGDMQQRDIAQPRKIQQVRFGELLLRQRAPKTTQAFCRSDGRRGGACL